MKALFFFLTLLTSFNICYGSLFSQNFMEENDQTVGELLSNFPKSIDGFNDEKIYLKPASLELYQKGILVKEDNKILLLPVVFSDISGSYLPLSDLQKLSIIRCIGCGWPRFSDDYCKNPDCPLYRE